MTWNQINVGTPSTDTSGDDEWDLDSQYSTGFAPGVTSSTSTSRPSLDDQRHPDHDHQVGHRRHRQAGQLLGRRVRPARLRRRASPPGWTRCSSRPTPRARRCSSPAVTPARSARRSPASTAFRRASRTPTTRPRARTASASAAPACSVQRTVTEIAWYAGGGGLSPMEPAATFQANTQVLGVAPLTARGVPDVSLDADPESGYDVVVDGSRRGDRRHQRRRPVLAGHLGPGRGRPQRRVGVRRPGALLTEPSSAYHDITLGANGLYTAGPGYDLVTGPRHAGHRQAHRRRLNTSRGGGAGRAGRASARIRPIPGRPPRRPPLTLRVPCGSVQ